MQYSTQFYCTDDAPRVAWPLSNTPHELQVVQYEHS